MSGATHSNRPNLLVVSELGAAADEAQGFGKPWTGPMTPVVYPKAFGLIDDHKKASCTGKARYSCKKDAITVAAGAMSRRRNRPKQLRAYPCPHCDGWHLTSKELRA